MQPVHLILICAPSQQGQVGAILGARCYQLALPAGSREQVEGDCRTHLMQQCSSDLLEHIQDAARCVHQHGEVRGAGKQAQQQQQDLEGAGAQQQQQQQQGASAAAAAMPAAARRLAERLAGALAEAHCSALAAHSRQLSTHPVGGCASTGDAPSGSNSSSNGEGCASPVALWSAQDLACQALPLSKPADAICSMQQLLRSLRQPLAARRSALAAGLAGVRRYKALLQHVPTAAANSGTPAAPASAAAAATAAAAEVHRSPALPADVLCMGQEAAASAGTGKLLADLGVLEAKWAVELSEVRDSKATKTSESCPCMLCPSRQCPTANLLYAPTA